ncbi:hypothetical protein HDV00_003953 [Rhizophlyctis rosea]|nr:hypothetical protein HDV00_003953 [Rhizophlyctis rosea]
MPSQSAHKRTQSPMDLASILQDPSEEVRCPRPIQRPRLRLDNLPSAQDFLSNFTQDFHPNLPNTPPSPTPSSTSVQSCSPGSPTPSLLSESARSESPESGRSPSPPPSPLSSTSFPSNPKSTSSKLKRKRATASQLAALVGVFEKNFFPSTLERERLARELNMTPRAVQIWFQNRRQSWRNTYGSGGLRKGVGAKTAEKNTKDWRFCAEFDRKEKDLAAEHVEKQCLQEPQQRQQPQVNQPDQQRHVSIQSDHHQPTPTPTPHSINVHADGYFAFRPASAHLNREPSYAYPASPYGYPYPYPSPCCTPTVHLTMPFPSPSIYDHPSPSPYTHQHQQHQQQPQPHHHQHAHQLHHESNPRSPNPQFPPHLRTPARTGAPPSAPVNLKLQLPKTRKVKSNQVLPPISAIFHGVN